MISLSNDYINSKCKIKEQNDQFLAHGTISNITDDYVEIKFHPDTHFLIVPNKIVKLSIVNEKLGSKVVVGKVYVGTNDFVRIVEIVTLMDFEKRDFFRITINQPAKIYLTKELMSDEDVFKKPSENIMIGNISLCGVFIITKNKLAIDDIIYLSLKLAKGDTLFGCAVKRIDDSTNIDVKKNGYGCQFIDANESDIDQLYRYIFEMQLEFLKNSKNKQ